MTISLAGSVRFLENIPLGTDEMIFGLTLAVTKRGLFGSGSGPGSGSGSTKERTRFCRTVGLVCCVCGTRLGCRYGLEREAERARGGGVGFTFNSGLGEVALCFFRGGG